VFISEEMNHVKSMGKEYIPGSKKKGKAFIYFLKEHYINMFVSSEYCQY